MIVKPSQESLTQAVQKIRNSELVVFPTETVYGLGANALDQNAVEKIYLLKKRPLTNPLIVHLLDLESVIRYSECSAQQQSWISKLQKFWPGPLTLVLPKSQQIPDIVSANLPGLGFRIPNHPVALDFLRLAEVPIAAPSANPSNYVSPTTAQHVEESFGAQAPLILDGGPCSAGIESTILSLMQARPRLLRPGIITMEELSQTLGLEIVNEVKYVKSEGSKESPGQLELHYSPKAKVVFYDRFKTNSEANIGQIRFSSTNPELKGEVITLSANQNMKEVAKELFAALRKLDNLGCSLIVVDRPKSEGIGLAILDRLTRAIGN